MTSPAFVIFFLKIAINVLEMHVVAVFNNGNKMVSLNIISFQ